ncbi:hypothetical protein B4089_3714 [Bacillus licheniformis]|nr:hypothetical protein B4089_3625 [Bacillus licheniformis]OLF87244.1 hypothetical protein B4089_3714 [Bacillus licheniformis]
MYAIFLVYNLWRGRSSFWTASIFNSVSNKFSDNEGEVIPLPDQWINILEDVLILFVT